MSVAARFGVSPSECLYIGDTNTDMQTEGQQGCLPWGAVGGSVTEKNWKIIRPA